MLRGFKVDFYFTEEEAQKKLCIFSHNDPSHQILSRNICMVSKCADFILNICVVHNQSDTGKQTNPYAVTLDFQKFTFDKKKLYFPLRYAGYQKANVEKNCTFSTSALRCP
jgi:hypothetical protein